MNWKTRIVKSKFLTIQDTPRPQEDVDPLFSPLTSDIELSENEEDEESEKYDEFNDEWELWENMDRKINIFKNPRHSKCARRKG